MYLIILKKNITKNTSTLRLSTSNRQRPKLSLDIISYLTLIQLAHLYARSLARLLTLFHYEHLDHCGTSNYCFAVAAAAAPAPVSSYPHYVAGNIMELIVTIEMEIERGKRQRIAQRTIHETSGHNMSMIFTRGMKAQLDFDELQNRHLYNFIRIPCTT